MKFITIIGIIILALSLVQCGVNQDAGNIDKYNTTAAPEEKIAVDEILAQSADSMPEPLAPPPAKPVENAPIVQLAEKRKDVDLIAADKTEVTVEEKQDFNTEEYETIYENEFLAAITNPLSTFSIDVDTASYSNIRRFLNRSQMPYKDAVRIEEMINYFNYDYPYPEDEHPFAITTEISIAPWQPEHRLIHIGLQGKKLKKEKAPASNLVFLLDVSGSMSDYNKLPLLKKAFKMLVNQLSDKDMVSIVVYAGAAGVVLEPTSAKEKNKIFRSLRRLEAGGSTAGGQGIELAYKVAQENFIKGGNNRIILATDGDFNIGTSSTSELERLIVEKRNQKIYLTVLGFGMGNYKDNRMETLADKGNGNYAYIDTIKEAEKVFVHDLTANLYTIAKDVKIQIEFNPNKVESYRLIGYENRMLKKEDFEDDTKDAGELGAGHTVTALYEIIPAKSQNKEDKLRYQETKTTEMADTDELMLVKLRYKQPDQDTSILITQPLVDKHIPLDESSDNFRFSAAVAQFGLLLRDSKFKGNATYEKVIQLAKGALGEDIEGYRHEFIELVKMARGLSQ